MKHLSLIVFAVLCTACVSHRVWEQPAVLHAAIPQSFILLQAGALAPPLD